MKLYVIERRLYEKINKDAHLYMEAREKRRKEMLEELNIEEHELPTAARPPRKSIEGAFKDGWIACIEAIKKIEKEHDQAIEDLDQHLAF